MLIERTKTFHKLSFGTRWNMRDTVRHKSRTAMSLVGTIGCVLLIVASFGMKDTMASFISLFYENATKYDARIYIADDADPKEVEKLAEKYNGDTGCTLSVQLEDKPVALEIYDINHGLVRFLREDNSLSDVEDDGAFICLRLAEEYGIEKGDTVTVSPYGSDEKYSVKIAGTFRSLSKSIALSKEYAEKLDIPYTVNSIFTCVQKGDIENSDLIKNVQSKSMILDSFNTFMGIMNTMIYLLVVGAMLLGLVVLYNLGVMSYTERYREMATLKVVGFKDAKIGRLLISQNLWLSLIGIVIGLPVGVLTLKYMMAALASEYEIMPVIGLRSYLISIVLTMGVSLIVSLMVAHKNKKIDMVEALKGVE
jgi:putative ABC transport system permease protein